MHLKIISTFKFDPWLPWPITASALTKLGTSGSGHTCQREAHQPFLPGTCVALPVTLRHWLSSQATASIPGWPRPPQESPELPGDSAHPRTAASHCPLRDPYSASTPPALQSEGMGKLWVGIESGARKRSWWLPRPQRTVTVISDHTTRWDNSRVIIAIMG